MVKLNLPEAAVSDAAILDRVILPKSGNLPVLLARHILSMKFSSDDVDRINGLSAKAREGTLNQQEGAELDSYLRVGHFLSMMKSKARLALKRSSRSA